MSADAFGAFSPHFVNYLSLVAGHSDVNISPTLSPRYKKEKKSSLLSFVPLHTNPDDMLQVLPCDNFFASLFSHLPFPAPFKTIQEKQLHHLRQRITTPCPHAHPANPRRRYFVWGCCGLGVGGPHGPAPGHALHGWPSHTPPQDHHSRPTIGRNTDQPLEFSTRLFMWFHA